MTPSNVKNAYRSFAPGITYATDKRFFIYKELQMDFHAVANIFPMMSPDEYEGLKADIQSNGLIEPIWTYKDKIIDGRNRFRACQDLGVVPTLREYQGDETNLVSFVVSLNLQRRHLNSGQRAIIATEIEPVLAVLAKDRQIKGAESKIDNDQVKCQVVQGFEQPDILPAKGRSNKNKSSEQAAVMVGTNRQYVSDAKKIKSQAPDLIPHIMGGDISLPDAKKIMGMPEDKRADIVEMVKSGEAKGVKDADNKIKKDERQADISKQLDDIRKDGGVSPSGLYGVIALDPPWPYGTQYDPNGRRAANPYPEMSLEEIKAIELPAHDDCVLWLWTTHKFMRHSFELLDAWDFRDVAILTWVKDRMGLGTWLRSQSEFCIMAVKGKPKVNLVNQTTIISGPLREHSRKPDEFYSMVDGLCFGRKLEYFSRQQREGWAVFGNDTEKF